MHRILTAFGALAFALTGTAIAAPVPADKLAKPPANAETWYITSAAGKHGQSQRWTDAKGVHWSRESLNLRGFVNEIDQAIKLAKDGSVANLTIRGFTPTGDAGETFSTGNGEYTFKSPVDSGNGKSANALYVPVGGTLDANITIANALMSAPGHTLSLLPSGKGRIEQLTSGSFSNGEETKTLTAFAITGFGFSPFPIWYEGSKFFGIANVISYLPPGWEKAAPDLIKAQDAAFAAQAPALLAKLAPKATAPIAFTNVRIFDSLGLSFKDPMTVVVDNGKITAVGAASSIKVPKNAQVIDGTGKTLVPGLWDNHQHYGDDYTGPLLLAQGITSVRDPGNQAEPSEARHKRIDNGELLGPRIVPSLMIDGPGKYSAQSAVVVTNEAEAIAAVHRAKDHGYFAIKIYGSVPPKLVKVMAGEAHKLGMRVHGHVPAGMRPLDAVRDGYDELTHIYFVMMQAMPDEMVAKSNTNLRILGTGRYAADVDLNAAPMKPFLDELQQRHTAADPTLVVAEGTLVPEAGEVPPEYTAYMGTLPPTFERGAKSGGMVPPEGVTRQRFRDSFAKLVALVADMHKRGITILPGTDGSGLELIRELELYVSAGFSNAEALASATITPAKTFKLDKQIGSITKGKLAELALIDGDPSKNIGDLRLVELVLRDGRVMRASDLRDAVGISGPPHRVP